MKKIYLLSLMLLLLFGFRLSAQNITVTGTVTSEDDGTTLPGVTVLIKGTFMGTTTDIDGNYKLENVPSDTTLVFSFIGMNTREIPVNGNTIINVVMQTEAFGLDELVVIGFGTVKKKDLTGSVSLVGAKTIEKIKPVKVEEALQGTVTGVNVTSQSGAPGAGLDIRIRGIGTNTNAAPLVIIDGYEGDLNTINPNDIESITVLKDAQAAIYGTVGANGVVLVKTKSGQKNTPTRVDINSSYSIQETARKIPLLNASEYAVLLNESYAANGEDLPYPDISGLGLGTNWQDELFNTAPMYDHNIRIHGGSEKTTYSVSASDFGQEGIIGLDKSEFQRRTAAINFGADLTDWLSLKSSLMYAHLDRKSINDFGLGSVLFNAINMPSTIPVYDVDGEYFLAPSNLGIEIINPLQQIANTFNDYDLNKFSGNFSLESDFTEHLTATARIGFNTTYDKYKSFSKIIDYGGKVFDVTRSSVYQDRNNYNDYTMDAFANYDNTFGDVHHFTATLGMTVYQTWGNHLDATGYDIPNNSWEFADISLANGLNTTKNINSWVYDQRRLSYFTRIQYDYNGRYLLSGMIRRDASTKFGPDNAVAYFPSVTAGWIISEEDFMKEINAIDLMKLRASYGFLGSDLIPSYGYISQLTGEATYIFDGQLVYGKAIGTLANPSIGWEQEEQFDIGLDVKLWNDRVDFTADYYLKNRIGLLIPYIPVSGILGTAAPGGASPTVNAGTVRNQGFEFMLGYKGAINKDFSYQLNYTLTTIKNEVLEVDNGTGIFYGGVFGVGQPYPSYMEAGYPIGYFYGYVTDGIFQTQEEVDAHPSQIALGAEAQPGDIRFKDINNDGTINEDDKTYIGDAIPDVIMGLNITLQYKGFDFIAYTYVSLGNDIVRNYERTQPNVNRLAYNLDRWTGPGTSNTVPRVTTAATANNVLSDYFVEDGSYLRIQRVQLGYKLPETIVNKIKMKGLRVYASTSNIFTLTNYQGFDPASATSNPIGTGFDSGFYPAARVYTLGINLNI